MKKINDLRTLFIHRPTQYVGSFIQRFPIIVYVAALASLFALIVLGNQLRKPKEEPAPQEPAPTAVEVFLQDGQPMIEMTARIEKDGVITVVAQSAGVVRKVHVTEGKSVKQAATLVSLSTTYQGGNAPSVTRQIAQRSTTFSRETFEMEKDLIERQKEIARKADTQADELREIGRKSFDDTKATISINEDLLKSFDTYIRDLELTNVGGINDGLIRTAKQNKAGILSALSSLRSGLRTSEYQSADDKAPAQLSDASRDLTIKQLEFQYKSLELSRDLSELNLKLARVSEQLMYPAAPCPGVVERVYVSVGQAVTPGTPIATLRANKTQATAIVSVPSAVAQQVNELEPSLFVLGGKEVALYPRYISREATEGSLFSIQYTLPDELTDAVAHESVLSVKVPIGAQTTSSTLIAPLDAIYQSTEKAYVYVVTATESAHAGQSGQVAQLREVTLGQVTGEYVEILGGIENREPIITVRGVTNGQAVIISTPSLKN